MLGKKLLIVVVFALFLSSLALAAESPATHPKTGAPLVMSCARGTPKAIDGKLDDWNLKPMTSTVLDTKEQIFTGAGTWTGPADCSGTFYLLWDDKNIYVAIVVKDDKIVANKDGGNIWNADAAEIFFTLPQAAATHAGTEHYQFGLSAKGQRWNWCNMDGAGQKDPTYVQVAAAQTADGYNIEAAIDYSNMKKLAFKAGEVLGFHPVLDDTDATDRELQMTSTGREAHDQSKGFGQVTLLSAMVTNVDPKGKAALAWGAMKAK